MTEELVFCSGERETNWVFGGSFNPHTGHNLLAQPSCRPITWSEEMASKLNDLKVKTAERKKSTYLKDTGVSENVVYPIVPNGFADHYPY